MTYGQIPRLRCAVVYCREEKLAAKHLFCRHHWRSLEQWLRNEIADAKLDGDKKLLRILVKRARVVLGRGRREVIERGTT